MKAILVLFTDQLVKVGLVFLSDVSCQMKAGLMHNKCIVLGIKAQWSTKAFNVTSVLFIL